MVIYKYMSEERRSPRYAAEGINCNIMHTAMVDIIDINASGAALLSHVRLDINKEYALRLEEKDTIVPVRGVVMWSVLGGSAKGRYGEVIPIYEVGMKFTDVTPERIPVFNDFIGRLRISEDQRVIARVDIRPPEKAALHFLHCNKVRIISKNGMLIEAEQSCKVEDAFPVELLLPGGESIKVFGKVASCLKGPENTYGVGIEFFDILPGDRSKLDKFIDTLKVTKVDSSIT
jgi:hypothetical protein